MRTLSSDILLELQKRTAVEPIVIVGVNWKGSLILYSDKELPGVHGKVISIGNINHALVIQKINSSSVTVRLSDTDGLVRGLYDTSDLHKRECFIYQHLGGINKRFTIFKGLTNSPITWDESTREISFEIISEIEGAEVGFSPEQAQYDYVSEDAVGKAWPLCFGDVLHVPATKVRSTPKGTLKTKIDMVDATLYYKLLTIIDAYFQSITQYNYYKQLASRMGEVVSTMINEIVQYQSAAQVVKAISEQVGTASTPVEATTIAYVYLIGQEDKINRDTASLDATVRTKKQELEDKKAGRIPWGTLSPKKTREELKRLRTDLQNRKKLHRDIVRAKKIVEKYIDVVEWELDVQHKAFQKQTEVFNQIVELYAQYQKVLEEYCQQKKNVTDVVYVEGGEDFPQNTQLDLLINNMRVRGSFSDKKFTITNILPKYTNVPLGERQPILNNCGDDDETLDLNTFFVADRSYNLKKCWALVQSVDGTYHIINIKEQDRDLCYFDLVKPDQDFTGGGSANWLRGPSELFSSSARWPLYYGPNIPKAAAYAVYQTPWGEMQPIDFMEQNSYVSGFNNYVNTTLQRYQADPLDADENKNLYRLQRLYRFDVGEDYLFFDPFEAREVYNVIGVDIRKILEVAAVPLEHWFDRTKYNIDVFEMPDDALWSGDPGNTVTDFNNPFEVYVANIVPSDVYCVSAYRVNEKGETILDIVPDDYYTLNESENLGLLTVTSLKFYVPLSQIQGEQWNDQIYVSLQSSISNNVVDILIYLIEKYCPGKTWDATTFNNVKSLFGDKYPANFALFERKDVLTLLQEIAFQARCQIVMVDDCFYLYYLAKEPSTVRTINDSDIETGTLNLGYTATGDLVTKYTAVWREDYLPDTKEKKIVLRNNMDKYGLHEQEYNFYIFNIKSLVMKSATFWMLRYSNTFKTLNFKTFLKQLDLQLYACVDVQTSPAIFGKCLIEEINYDPANHDLTVSLATPILAGTDEQYKYYWPSETDKPYPPESTGPILDPPEGA